MRSEKRPVPRDTSAFISAPVGLLVGLMLLLVILVSTHSGLMRYQIEQAKIDSLQRLGAYKTSLLATIDRHLYLPQVLASDPRVVEAFRASGPEQSSLESNRRISRLLSDINQKAGSEEIFLMNPRGETLSASNYDSPYSFVGSNYGYRPYFREAINGNSGFYFAVGATTGIPGLFLSAPVYSDAGGVLGVIVIKIDLRKLEQSWHESGDAVWVTDEKGVIFLASSRRWRYSALRPLPEDQLQALSETRQYGDAAVKPLEKTTRWQAEEWSTYKLGDSEPQLVFGSALAGYPWKMHLRMPLARVQSQVHWMQALLVLVYTGLHFGGLFYRERRRRTSAQKAVARLSAERESHQRAIIQNSDVGLLNLNAEFEPLFFNEQARNLFQLSDRENVCHPSEVISPWDPGKAGMGSCRAEGVRFGGSRFPILYTLNPIRVGDQDEFILTVQDITELTEAQQALQKINKVLEQRVKERTRDLENAQAALAQNQKLAALGRMSAAIAHEINQPITALSNFVANSEILLQRNQLDAVSQNFRKIEGLLERLSKLSRQLRIFAGKRNTGSAFVLLHAPIKYALELLEPRLQAEGVECHLELRRDYSVRANTMVLEQILVNLLTNAVDAVKGRDAPRIDIRFTELEGKPGWVCLSIEDNGHGMDENQIRHVFEPFFTTKPMGKGLGLGLAISYSLACDIGAELTATSEIDKGSCFALELPVAGSMNRDGK